MKTTRKAISAKALEPPQTRKSGYTPTFLKVEARKGQ